MLQRLSISNYALIEQLDLRPDERLSIITGETGAGKSVMLGALNLLRGERADSKAIADKERKSVVEASFGNIDGALTARILEVDPEWDGSELIVRREILPSGRSRAFVNDTPASLAQLGDITRELLDIHSQNSNSILSRPRMQLSLIDSVAANGQLLAKYTADFQKYVDLRQKIKTLREESEKNREQAEVIAFKLDQLDRLKPKAGELRKIEQRYELLSNSEEIRERLIKARRALSGAESSGALENIDEAAACLADIDFTVWEEEDPRIRERLRQCMIEIKDMADTIESVLGDIDYDPAAIEALSSRMRDYYTALKTFRAEDDAALERLHLELRRQLRTVENVDADTEEMEREARATALRLKEAAAGISSRRRKAAEALQSQIETEASRLGLANLNFRIAITGAKLSKTGGDSVEFLAAFNKNQQPLPVGDIASGGEMARLMLAIKKITSERLSLPTVIFDEIDTGVSGSIADRMGEMMREMSAKTQIITITHLPQVASKGDLHFKVYKEDREDKTVSDIMTLDEAQREQEIARMLAGEVVDDAAIQNARSLLKNKR